MVFHQFYSYGAFLFALGVIEVATVTPYDVTSIKSGDFSDDIGCFVYYPHRYLFEFIPKTYYHYDDIKNTLLQAGDEKGILLAEGKNRKVLFHAYQLIAASRDMIGLNATKNEGEEYFLMVKITYYEFDYEDKSLQFQYNFENYKGVKQVKIIFSDDAGLKAITDILSDAGTICMND